MLVETTSESGRQVNVTSASSLSALRKSTGVVLPKESEHACSAWRVAKGPVRFHTRRGDDDTVTKCEAQCQPIAPKPHERDLHPRAENWKLKNRFFVPEASEYSRAGFYPGPFCCHLSSQGVSSKENLPGRDERRAPRRRGYSESNCRPFPAGPRPARPPLWPLFAR